MEGKNIRFVLLFDLYGGALSESQQEMFDLYYNEDFSLSEVAESVGITRQGVHESIKRSEEQLLSFEEKLGIAERFRARDRLNGQVCEILRSIRGKAPEFTEQINLALDLLVPPLL